MVLQDGERVGCLLFGRPEATACYTGGLTYGSQADVAAGRAAFDRWEIVNLARVWLHPDVQAGGPRFVPCAARGRSGQRCAASSSTTSAPSRPASPMSRGACRCA
jgi:hypothetical protein